MKRTWLYHQHIVTCNRMTWPGCQHQRTAIHRGSGNCGRQRYTIVWPESTSTSPSGTHLGHYKALIARHSFSSNADENDLTPEFIERRNEINRKQEAIINYTLERGYSYMRWQSIVNSVLFKDPDTVRLHRTRKSTSTKRTLT